MRFSSFLTFLLIFLAGCAAFPPFTAELPARSVGGMVVSDDMIASEAGVEILSEKGNAIDAAVATAFALAVVYPEAGNLGGGGFLVARLAEGKSLALDFREKAPLAATRNMFLDTDGNPTDRSLIGHRAAGVPGSVAGLWEAHEKYGRLPWNRVLAPALRLAREGSFINRRFARTLRSDSSRLVRFQASQSLFFIGKNTLREGTLWKNTDLMRTLERIAARGAEEFYAGATADSIVAEMRRGDGIITPEDLASYRPVWRTPLEFSYRGHRVVSMPPPSSGGVTLALLCNILSHDNLQELGWNSAAAVHLEVEAMRRAFAIRNAFLGDPDVVRIPMDSLLSSDFATAQRSSISDVRATPSDKVTFGSEATPPEGNHTTHISVVDAEGNAVALTTTLNALYGNAVVVAGAGFLLNNEMDDFAVKPGTPNMFGLVQGEPNAIAPGKRILSSMTPTIVCTPDGSPMIVTGARGGPFIITSVFQVISNILDHEMDLPAAITAPRFHHQHLPDFVLWEANAFSATTLQNLERLGHILRRGDVLGSAPTLFRDKGCWSGMGDPRTGGGAKSESPLP
jgi:gamma-glutamyltranspeptidase/glutathione hydrolase